MSETNDVDCLVMRFKDLPIGARYKYPGSGDIWVVVQPYGYGLVAKWEGLKSGVRQSMCCFVDDEWSLESTVTVVDA
jgi:hypothetical protein